MKIKQRISFYRCWLRIKIGALLQITLSYILVRWLFRGGRLQINSSTGEALQPPFLVLGNHTSNIDPALVQFILTPQPCYFLTTNFYFRHPLLGKLLRLAGAIPKVQFLPDLRAAHRALALLNQDKIVGIFPEGRRSIDGSCGDIPYSIARFIQKAKVPVLTVKTQGGYFVWPRWSSFWRPGQIEVTINQLLTGQEAATLPLEQLHAKVREALSYNDYDWNRQAGHDYSHRRAAERLDLILHQCPRCLRERSMNSRQNKLYCEACGNTALLDRHGFLQPAYAQCITFATPVQWSAWQQQQMLSLIENKNFRLQLPVKEIRVADPLYGPYRRCSNSGQVNLYQEGLYFHGKIDGQMRDLFFPIERLPTVSTEFNYDFEICDTHNAWWIFLEERQQTIRLENAIALLHQLRSSG